jgi:hypothetical protein
MAGTTGLEPATSAVTGQRSNQLNYVPAMRSNDLRQTRVNTGYCRFCLLCTVRLEESILRLLRAEPPTNRLQKAFRDGVHRSRNKA